MTEVDRVFDNDFVDVLRKRQERMKLKKDSSLLKSKLSASKLGSEKITSAQGAKTKSTQPISSAQSQKDLIIHAPDLQSLRILPTTSLGFFDKRKKTFAHKDGETNLKRKQHKNMQILESMKSSLELE